MAEETPSLTLDGASRPPTSDYSPQLTAGREGLPQLWGRQGFWQIRLRWAVAPLMIAGIVIGRLLGFEFRVVPILVIALASLIYNALLALVLHRYRDRLESDARLDRIFITTEVIADYAAMFLLIYFTGGAASPLAIFLLFHVIIAAIQFAAPTAYALAGVAAGGLWLLLLGGARRLAALSPPRLSRHGAQSGRPARADRPGAGFPHRHPVHHRRPGRAGSRRGCDGRVGDLAEATSDLARSHVAVQALMHERAQFTLEVAHNLRAPLAAGLGIVDLLRGGYVGELTEKQDEQLGRLDQRLRALNETIGELLAIARTRDWSREIEDVVVDLRRAGAPHRERPSASVRGGQGPRLPGPAGRRTCHRSPAASACSSS